MFNKFLFIHILVLFFTISLYSLDIHVPVYTIQAKNVFDGDRHDDFKNDLVAVLSDGSCWKVHPKDTIKFNGWDYNDVVQVRKRTSFYWFKREHKFELFNHFNGESIRVMLVGYPKDSTYIQATETYLAETQIRSYSWVDASGWVHYQYYPVSIYHKLLYLSNGTLWIIMDNSDFSYFNVNDLVYMGFNNDKRGVSPFLISGIAREARWAWAYPK